MKNKLFILPMIALASTALGQEAVEEVKPAAVEQAKPTLMELFDVNKDGALQEEEIKRVIVKLKALDKDKDGTVSAEELAAPVAAKKGRPTIEERLANYARLDKNKDGKVSKEEAPGKMKANFEKLDTNDDGFFDKAEQEALLERFKK